MSGLNAGATLGGAIGGLTSRSHRGYHMGTTIGALSGAAIGAVATMPRKKRVETTETVESYEAPKRKRGSFAPTATLSGMRRDVRVTNVNVLQALPPGSFVLCGVVSVLQILLRWYKWPLPVLPS